MPTFFRNEGIRAAEKPFSDDRVIVLYSVNFNQLARVVEGMYGQGFDGQRYFSRFYDLTIPLRKVIAYST